MKGGKRERNTNQHTYFIKHKLISFEFIVISHNLSWYEATFIMTTSGLIRIIRSTVRNKPRVGRDFSVALRQGVRSHGSRINWMVSGGDKARCRCGFGNDENCRLEVPQTSIETLPDSLETENSFPNWKRRETSIPLYVALHPAVEQNYLRSQSTESNGKWQYNQYYSPN